MEFKYYFLLNGKIIHMSRNHYIICCLEVGSVPFVNGIKVHQCQVCGDLRDPSGWVYLEKIPGFCTQFLYPKVLDVNSGCKSLTGRGGCSNFPNLSNFRWVTIRWWWFCHLICTQCLLWPPSSHGSLEKVSDTCLGARWDFLWKNWGTIAALSTSQQWVNAPGN